MGLVRDTIVRGVQIGRRTEKREFPTRLLDPNISAITREVIVKREEYQKYLASREWALLKERVRERSGGICERCKSAPHQATHHLTYERVGQELLEDLLGVCEPCHEFVSG